MAIVGRASVVITALTNTFKEDLRKAFADVESEAEASGQRAGGRFGESFGQAASEGIHGVSFDRAGEGAEAAGGRSGGRFASSFDSNASNLGSDIEGALGTVERDADSSGNRAGGNWSRSFNRRSAAGIGDDAEHEIARLSESIGRSGENAGKELGSGIEDAAQDGLSAVVRDAEGAGNNISRNFKSLDVSMPDFGGAQFVGKILALIPLIGVLGGAIGALVGGLAALAGAAVYAAGSLAIVATGVGALALGLGAGILAFSGISKAVSALNAQQKQSGAGAAAAAKAQQAATDAVTTAQQRLISATQGVADAQFNLERARRQAAEQSVQDEHAVRAAEYALAQAQLNARQSQLALTQARQAAAQQLVTMQLQLRGANIGVEQAQLSLQEAQERYAKTLGDPSANQEQREQARIDLESAELTLDQANEQKTRAEKTAEDANRKGVEGSDQVVKAKQQEANANHSVADAEYNLAQARQKQTDDAVNSAHAILDAQNSLARSQRELGNAQRALAEAQKTLADGGAAAKRAADNVAAAMKDLSPAAQAFARYISGLKPKLTELKNAAGEQLFGPLTEDLKTLSSGPFWGVLKSTLSEGGKGLGQFFGEITRALNSPDIKNGLTAFSKGLTQLHTDTKTSDFQDMGTILGNLLKIFVGLARAAEPTFHTFLQFLTGITGKNASLFSTSEGVARVAGTIKDMGRVAGQFGHIFGALFKVILNVFGPGGGLKAGRGLLTDLSGAMDKLVTNTGKGGKSLGPIQDFFKNIKGPFESIIKLAVSLGGAILKMGEDGTLTKLFDDIREAIPKVVSGIQTFTDKVAPALVKIVTQIIDVFQNVVNSPAFPTFVDTVTAVATVIGDLIKAITGSPLAGFAGVLVGLGAAFFTLKGAFDKSGLKSVFNLFKGGFGDPKKLTLKDAKGPIGTVQGLRGKELLEKGYDPATGEDKVRRTASNQRGFKIRKTLDTPVGELASGVASSARGKVSGAAGATRRALSGKAGAIGGTVAIGLTLADAARKGQIDGLGPALAAAGALVTTNLSGILTQFAPQIFQGVASGIGIASKAVEGLGLTTKIASGATKAWTLIQGAFNLVMLANPVVLIIAAVVALGVAIYEAYQHFGPFHDLVDRVWQALQRLWDIIWNALKTAIDWMIKHIQILLLALGPLGLAIDAIIFIFKHWHQIIGIVTHAIRGVIKFFTDLPGRVRGFVGEVVGFVRDLPGQIIGFVARLGSAAGRVGHAIVHGIVHAVSTIGQNVGDFIGRIPGQLLGFVENLASAAGRLGSAIWNGIKNGLLEAAQAVGDIGLAVFNSIGGFINQYAIDPINETIHHQFHLPLIGDFTLAPDSIRIPDIPKISMALGGTVLPRTGGTLVNLAEAGKAESVVDTGLLNRQLEATLTDRRSNAGLEASMQRVEALLERIRAMGGITVEHIAVQAAPKEPAASSLPRALRSLAFELGS